MSPEDSLRHLLREATARLAPISSEPRREAGILLADLLGLDSPLELRLRTPAIDADVRRRFESQVLRRSRGEPLQYVLGHTGFWRDRFSVWPGVLIPQPDTEALVEVVLEGIPGEGEGLHALEIGPGTGAVALSLLGERPSLRITAVEIAAEAVRCTRENALALGRWNRLALVRGDLLEPIDPDARFDLIVSNPPYVAPGDELDREVRDHAPGVALLGGGADGLDMIRRILEAAPPRLRPGGRLAVEIGASHAAAVRALVEDTAGLSQPFIRQDLAGRDRVLVAVRNR